MASRVNLASLFVVSAEGGEPRQMTNVGLVRGPIDSGSRIPEATVPPPVNRSSMRWDATGIHFNTAASEWRLDPASGEAIEEVLQ